MDRMMVLVFGGRFPLIVVYAIFLHLTWAATLFEDDRVGGVTAVASTLALMSRPMAIAVFVSVALLALCASFALNKHRRWASLMMVPQQLVLFLSAGGAMGAMWMSQFADGVIRPRAFLIADQIPAVLAAAAHMIATLNVWYGQGPGHDTN